MKVLIIIPAYNESESIEKVVRGLINDCPDYDYVVVNDCSTDSTLEILKSCGFSYINLPANLGIGGAVQCGYLYAAQHNYDVAVQFDGDGQHSAEYIPALIAPIAEGRANMVIGSRFIERQGFQTSFMRRLGIRIIKGVIRCCCGVSISDTTSGFRAADKELIKVFSLNYAQDYPEPEAIVTAALEGYHVDEIPVVMNERTGGTTSISSARSVYYMIKVCLALIIHRMSTHPHSRKGGK